jgi:AcrR family transcriptional regulator
MNNTSFDIILLPWEILETARSCFREKGFEKTSIHDVCTKLDLKETDFYLYFQSLDEVLEILWSR